MSWLTRHEAAAKDLSARSDFAGEVRQFASHLIAHLSRLIGRLFEPLLVVLRSTGTVFRELLAKLLAIFVRLIGILSHPRKVFG